MQKSKQTSYVVRCFAAIAIGVALFALCTRTEVRPDSLSPTESAIVGTWTYSDETGLLNSITFNSDRTCVFFGPSSKYPSRLRSDGATIFFAAQVQNGDRAYANAAPDRRDKSRTTLVHG